VDERTALRSLAGAWGLQASYTDATGRKCVASPESILAVLRLLGAPVARQVDVPHALRDRTLSRWRTFLEPVVAAREGIAAEAIVRLPVRELPAQIACRIELEEGDVVQQRFDSSDLVLTGESTVEGERFEALRLCLGVSFPAGYHKLGLEVGRHTAEALLIVAPQRLYGATERMRSWGVFLPLHALHGERSWGGGSYADLGKLVGWTADNGGRVVGTLPLLPTFLDVPFDPSPYRPVSRRMWSEFHIAVEAIEHLERCPEAQAVMRAPTFRRRLARLRSAKEVNHRRQLELQRSVLEPLAAAVCTAGSVGQAGLRRFLRTHPDVEDYARFRATTERRGRGWSEWPARLREGRLRQGDFSAASAGYHAFAQWVASEQLGAVARAADKRSVRLYLDLPLGVHPAGYDAWREGELFASGASAGAPPDAFFTGGQLWCFPPIRPERSRTEGHRYVASCLRHHMRPAGMLRVDHVMSLHRLFWVPEGHGPEDGVYVRYPADELYAVLCLESWRQRCVVVGEDLGTVAREVRPAMKRHGLRGTFVLPYGRSSNPRRPLESMKARGVAALRTHDMPTFAAFWRGLDIGRRVKLGHLAPEEAPRQREARRRLRTAWTRDLRRGGWMGSKEPGTAEALRACLAFLADSEAEVVLVDLEDLWGETEPQNVPGTSTEWPNWRRRARYSLEAFGRLRRIVDALRDLRAQRGGARRK